jgi:hypothetical protein
MSSDLTGRTAEPDGHYHNGSFYTDAECGCELARKARIPSLAETACYDEDETCMECGLDGPRCICSTLPFTEVPDYQDLVHNYVGKHRS